jgi:hypothetical protein
VINLMAQMMGLALCLQSLELIALRKHFKTSAVVFAQLILSVVLMVFAQKFAAVGLVVTIALICLGFRGNFNGGSDKFGFTIVLALAVTALFPALEKAAMLYLAIQLCLSYVIAGIVKLKNRQWRSGEALAHFLTNSNYAVPAFVKSLAHRKRVIMLASWIVIAFECSFFAAFVSPKMAVIYAVLGFFFHLGNFVALGLNRFFFVWLSAYPIIFYWNR